MPANEAQFTFKIEGKKLGVVDFHAQEELSYPYQVTLTLASEDVINFDDVIAKEALLTIIGIEGDRYFHGIVNQFMLTGSSGRFHLYQATVVPYLWLLSLEQDCRIFQKKHIKDIIGTILEEAGIPSDRFAFRLQGKYPEREYCVQYRETDLNFISRLLEEEGIFYFFEHKKDSHILVFGDSTVNYQPFDNNKKIKIQPGGGMVHDKEIINTLVASRQIQTGKITLKDFNFEKPSLDLTSDKTVTYDTIEKKLEMYDYPAEYMDKERGKTLTAIRMEETVTFRDKVEGQSDCCRFIPGFCFQVSNHDRPEIDEKSFLIVELLHTGTQPGTLEEHGGGGASSYSNNFTGIPEDVTYRPERKTPKPIVEGVQTAIVVGPSGDEIYTDKFGRIKVQFHWDREGKKDENSSCWIRVNQVWAGEGWGAMHVPRIGHEVIVDFVEGDPDRPIITGHVYHGTNMPPYTLPDEMTKSTIRSHTTPNGKTYNELLMEDKSGKTQVVLSNAYGHKITEDEETQALTIETRDKNKIVLDDKNKSITVQTTNAHSIIMSDTDTQGEGTIAIKTTNGNSIEMDDKNKKIVAHTTDGHTLLFDDENKKIEITSTDGHSALLSDDQENISITSKKGHFMAIDDSGDSITLEDSGGAHRFKVDIGGGKLIIATDSGSIDLEAASGTISVKGMDVSIEATNELKLKGGMNVTSEAGVQHTTKGTMISAESSGPHTVKGTPVQIN